MMWRPSIGRLPCGLYVSTWHSEPVAITFQLGRSAKSTPHLGCQNAIIMSNSPIQVQWSLSSTVASTITIGRDLVAAATSDNVQIIAILACQGLGNTLAMCNTTCDLIEKRVVPTPESTSVRFLKAMVGWSKVDSVTQMASNHAGVRFLGLAAAMMSSMDPLEAAQVLAEMIRDTAQDKSLVPTQKQLYDLWIVMTPRCSISGFTDRVLSWGSRFIDPNTGRLIFCAQPYEARGTSPKGLQRLVEAFREISRIGDASITHIRIQSAYENLPWLSAFTEWCLGVPPRITGHDGRIVQDFPDSPVSVSAVEASGHQEPFDITLYYVDNIPGPRQLVTADQHIELGGAIMSGMASLPEYGRYLRRLLGSCPGISQVAFNHALPFAVHQCFKLLRFSSMSVFDHAATDPMKAWADGDNGPMDEAMQNLTLSPFPDRHGRSVLHIMDLLFGLRNLPESLSSPPKEMLISEHPSVKAYLEEMQRSCTCYKCSEKDDSFSKCDQDTFYDNLSCIVADVMALGLFIGPDGLLVSLHTWLDASIEAQSLKVAIEAILRKGEPAKSTINALHMWSAYLTGYSFRPIDSTLLMSSGMGQTIWPSILDTRVIGKNGFLSLRWARGGLIFNGDKYELVHSPLTGNIRPDKEPGFQRQKHIWGIPGASIAADAYIP
ncbi:hypothetical protein FALCPG4_014871 [Fusarium falciforme]